MTIIVGLGNIGSEYENTKHNIGFKTVDLLAKILAVTFGPGGGPFQIAEGKYKGRKVVLVKPTTFMNRSGTAVKKVLAKYNEDIKNCLVIYDDLNLPVGAIRLRSKGSASGHNGISDINEKLGTKEYPRLRVGIGNNFPKGGQVDYVLSPFEDDDLIEIGQALTKAQDAALAFVSFGIERAMNSFN